MGSGQMQGFQDLDDLLAEYGNGTVRICKPTAWLQKGYSTAVCISRLQSSASEIHVPFIPKRKHSKSMQKLMEKGLSKFSALRQAISSLRHPSSHLAPRKRLEHANKLEVCLTIITSTKAICCAVVRVGCAGRPCPWQRPAKAGTTCV